jgi:soluble lytic murein transglycosylase
VDEALPALEAIGAEAHGATSAWARFLAALLLEGRGQDERARALFVSAADGASGKVASDARWRLAWSAYRVRDLDTARRRMQAYAAHAEDPLDGVAGRYWAARALAAAEPEAAARELAAIAAELPFSYYGWRAGARGAVAASAPIRDGTPGLGPGDLAAAQLLVEAGFDAAAVRAALPLVARAANVDDRIAVARVLVGAHDYHRAQSLLVRAYAGALARGPAAGQEELFRLAWPDAFAAERRAALPPDAAVDGWFVASILREESGYRPTVESVAGAIGLLQLMPDTGARLAAQLGVVGFTPARLVDPALNLRLGAFYLDQLARRFGGSLEATAASYNAGPEAVAGWLRAEGPPADEWVESIPYDETRAYVKRVLRSLHVHRSLYAETR